MKTLSVKEAIEKLVENGRNRIFSVTYKRANAKCTVCGRSNKKFNDLDVCPHCSGKLTKFRVGTGKIGVTDPKHALKPGTGQFIGESFEDALKAGRFKYFDMNSDEGKGDYRQFRVENLFSIKVNGESFLVKKGNVK